MNTSYMSGITLEDCVLMIIDCQYDFLWEGASLENPRGRARLPNIVEARQWAKDNQIPVIFTQEVHRHQRIDFGLEISRGDPEHCLEGTQGCLIVPSLTPESTDFVVVKRRYSGFYQTDLEIILRGLGRNTLILTGVDTNVCVYSTALEAQFRNLRTIVLSDCTAGTSEEMHKAFLANIEMFLGEVMTLAQFKEHFSTYLKNI